MCDHPSMVMFSTFFLPILIKNNTYNYVNVKQWTRQTDLFGKRMLLFPVNINNVHWIFVCVDVKFKMLWVLDSFDSKNGNNRVVLDVFMS